MKSLLSILAVAGVFLTTALAQIAPPTSSPDEQARFLTGRRVPPGSVLEPIQRSPEYLDHASQFSKTWKRFDEKYFSKMRAFSMMQLQPRIGSAAPVFYLFGGPDFINVYALFPNAPVYILGGLEPIGSIVPPERLDLPRIRAGLDNLRESTSVTLQFSHFITKDMKVDLEQTDFRGVLPILESFISLAGGTVVSVDYVGIGSGGDLRVLSGPEVTRGLLPGVQIRFRRNAGAPTQTVYYIQADVSDDAVKSNPALLKWMGSFAPAHSYLKAASYLMHEPYFSRVREFLLKNSSAILQDDSGIPLKYFRGDWRITFFGNYTGTLDIFKKYLQLDLDQAYSQMGSIPLDFGTGYKWQPGESNLMLAVKGAALAPAQPVAPMNTIPQTSSPPPF